MDCEIPDSNREHNLVCEQSERNFKNSTVVSEYALIEMPATVNVKNELMVESTPQDEDVFSTFYENTSRSSPGMGKSSHMTESKKHGMRPTEELSFS